MVLFRPREKVQNAPSSTLNSMKEKKERKDYQPFLSPHGPLHSQEGTVTSSNSSTTVPCGFLYTDPQGAFVSSSFFLDHNFLVHIVFSCALCWFTLTWHSSHKMHCGTYRVDMVMNQKPCVSNLWNLAQLIRSSLSHIMVLTTENDALLSHGDMTLMNNV